MTDILNGSPWARALEQQRDAERAAGLLSWLFSRDDGPEMGWTICGPLRSDQNRER